MRSASKKPLMHYLGEFIGHIVKAIRTDPGRKRIVVNKAVEEEDRDTMTLRRTTIEEIEFKRNEPRSP
ncbi:MAG: hypothetical protein O7F17_07065 [Planctomycetota bacterium]|nr:hypothetical protein [Planctomycetota bacterium]